MYLHNVIHRKHPILETNIGSSYKHLGIDPETCIHCHWATETFIHLTRYSILDLVPKLYALEDPFTVNNQIWYLAQCYSLLDIMETNEWHHSIRVISKAFCVNSYRGLWIDRPIVITVKLFLGNWYGRLQIWFVYKTLQKQVL